MSRMAELAMVCEGYGIDPRRPDALTLATFAADVEDDLHRLPVREGEK
ncbi:hypothetical protein [Puerhibacterium puerhi]|nr:hypothetical protein [Puerhibacterium puerhi]